jgi:hypothetical protein
MGLMESVRLRLKPGHQRSCLRYLVTFNTQQRQYLQRLILGSLELQRCTRAVV